MIVAPQSFGSILNPHAHLHAVSSLGVFDREGKFHSAPGIDFAPLEEIFRERTLKMMLEKEKITAERVELLRSWRHSGFHIDSSRRIPPGDRESLQSLLQYIERPPVSLDRLTYRADGMVHYQGGTFHPRLGRDHQLVTGIEFLAMLVPHIALRHEVTIGYYGALSTTTRRKFGWIKKDEKEAPKNALTVDDEESEFVKVRKRNWARLIAKVWKEDPELCPTCGSKMVVLAAISSPGQDDVIERILRHRQEWDPPWLRHRPARGPPRRLEFFQESQVPKWNPEDGNQDAAGDVWPE